MSLNLSELPLNILITAPGLDASQNVSGISSVALVITKNSSHSFHHYRLGSKDGTSKGLIWLFSLLYAYMKLPFYLRKNKIDIVHLNIPCDMKGVIREFFMTWVSNMCKKRVVAHLHGGIYMTEKIDNRLIAAMFGYILNKSSVVIVLSDVEKRYLSAAYRFDGAVVLSNSIEPGEKRKMFAADQSPCLLYLGRIEKNKGIDEIVEAFAKLYKERRFRFILCGEGPDRVWFEKALSDIMGGDFEYMGIVSGGKKAEAISQSDVFILPSYFEGLPMALLETMGYGVVPVVSSVGSIPEVVEHKENGILIEKKSAGDLYLKLNELLNDRDLICRLSDRAYDTIKERFNVSRFISRLNTIYREIAG